MLKNLEKWAKFIDKIHKKRYSLYRRFTLNNNLRFKSGGEKIMNKTELVAAMADKAGISKKDAEAALKAFTDTVSDELKKGEKVQLVGFGTFETSVRAAREGRNPQTKETIKIAASKAPKFKAGKALKDLVNA